jgi:hypothetical protein
MGRRLPCHTARKSMGERRLPDKTNNARDSSEDGSEVVRGKRPAAGGGGGTGGQPPEDGWPAAPFNNSLRLDIEDSHASKTFGFRLFFILLKINLLLYILNSNPHASTPR